MLVYRITNTVNGKVYIGIHGKTSDVQNRWMVHLKKAKCGSQLYIHRAIRKYGPGSFTVEVLHHAKTEEELRAMETFFIAQHQSHIRENGYNQTSGGDGLWNPSDELRRRLSRIHTETQASPEYRAKMSAKMKLVTPTANNCCKSKSVHCLDTGETFPSLQEVVERLGGCTRNLSRAIQRNWKFFGRRFEYVQ